jgi:hypothetical protein
MTDPGSSFQRMEMSEELQLLAALQRDIASRLRPICNQMEEAMFNELVRDIAAMKIKYGPDADVSGSLRVELQTLLDCDPDTKPAT